MDEPSRRAAELWVPEDRLRPAPVPAPRAAARMAALHRARANSV